MSLTAAFATLDDLHDYHDSALDCASYAQTDEARRLIRDHGELLESLLDERDEALSVPQMKLKPAPKTSKVFVRAEDGRHCLTPRKVSRLEAERIAHDWLGDCCTWQGPSRAIGMYGGVLTIETDLQ